MADQQNTMTLAQWQQLQAMQAQQQRPAAPSMLQAASQARPFTPQPTQVPVMQPPGPQPQPQPAPMFTTPAQPLVPVPAQYVGKPIGTAFTLHDGVISVEACARWTSAGRFDGHTLGGAGFIAGNH